MNLKILAENCVNTFGLRHTMAIRTLREYLTQNTTDALTREIKGIQDASTLKAVWEAGVRGNLQEVYLKRLGELS